MDEAAPTARPSDPPGLPRPDMRPIQPPTPPWLFPMIGFAAPGIVALRRMSGVPRVVVAGICFAIALGALIAQGWVEWKRRGQHKRPPLLLWRFLMLVCFIAGMRIAWDLDMPSWPLAIISYLLMGVASWWCAVRADAELVRKVGAAS